MYCNVEVKKMCKMKFIQKDRDTLVCRGSCHWYWVLPSKEQTLFMQTQTSMCLLENYTVGVLECVEVKNCFCGFDWDEQYQHY
jgi:hypothetical protein